MRRKQSSLTILVVTLSWACAEPAAGPDAALRPTLAVGGLGRPAVLVNPNANDNGTARTIQQGVDLVAEGGKVLVLPGTYAEAVVIDKAVTLEGVRAGVVLEPPAAASAGILVTTSDPVIIRTLTVHRRGVVGVDAVGAADLTLERITVLAVQVPAVPNAGVRLFNNSGLTGRRAHLVVRGSLIDGGGLPRSLGINLQADLDAVLDGNVIVRAGGQCIRVVGHQPGEPRVDIVNNHLDQCESILRFPAIDVGPVGPPLTPALPISMTGRVNVVGNTIRNSHHSCLPTNAVHYELYTGRIERNSIVGFVQDCTMPIGHTHPVAIWVGSLRGYTAASPIVRFNDIAGNAHAGLRIAPNIATTIDARCNYWGSADGPSGAGSGAGDALLVEGGGTTPAFQPFATAPIAATGSTEC